MAGDDASVGDAVRSGQSFGAWCIICRWTGERFLGREDGESADCPRCRAIARDRFLFWCFLTRTPNPFGLRVLETSPRLGEHYRERMRRWFEYTCSDFDSNSHRSELALDLQAIDLSSESLDVVLTPHVAGYFEMLHGRRPFPPSPAEGFHVDQLAEAVRLDEIVPVIDEVQAIQLGILPPYHFSTWEAIRPAGHSSSHSSRSGTALSSSWTSGSDSRQK